MMAKANIETSSLIADMEQQPDEVVSCRGTTTQHQESINHHHEGDDPTTTATIPFPRNSQNNKKKEEEEVVPVMMTTTDHHASSVPNVGKVGDRVSFFPTAVRYFVAASLLFLIVFGGVAAADAVTSNQQTKFFSQQTLSNSKNSMKQVLKAWRNGKTVVLENNGYTLSLSAHSGESYWSIAKEATEEVGHYKTIYKYMTRGHDTFIQVSCLDDGERGGYGSGASGYCSVEVLEGQGN